MSHLGTRAFGYTRMRALKRDLLGPDDAARLRSVPHRPALRSAAAELGIPGDRGEDVLAARLPRLVADYAKLLPSYPEARELLLALLRRHEVENLKLALRATARGLPADRWVHAWRPLGVLASLRREDWSELPSLAEARARAQRTPYAEVLTSTLPAAATSLLPVELALDAWVSDRVHAAAGALGAREAAARQLAELWVAERDLELVARGEHAYGLEPSWLERVRERARRLARGQGRSAVRHARRLACRRAFLAPPSRLAPVLAYLLLREEELSGLCALLEGFGEPEQVDTVREALEASALGED